MKAREWPGYRERVVEGFAKLRAALASPNPTKPHEPSRADALAALAEAEKKYVAEPPVVESDLKRKIEGWNGGDI